MGFKLVSVGIQSFIQEKINVFQKIFLWVQKFELKTNYYYYFWLIGDKCPYLRDCQKNKQVWRRTNYGALPNLLKKFLCPATLEGWTTVSLTRDPHSNREQYMNSIWHRYTIQYMSSTRTILTWERFEP